MRYLFILFAALLFIIIPGCKNMPKENKIKTTGTLEARGITSYQYGTHILETEEDFFALRSDTIDLTKYEGEKIRISATKIEGYPIEGGPAFLNVLKVEKAE
ncbi:hypothetical protein [Zunongwangia sp. H14]|uniref:hypothetical protein n=1 Tax=Zunongwangia sp. H14 TaxID=3240792 RepID=UPI0035630C63